MITEIVKGVDDEIEFKGFKGRYFYRLCWFVGILLALTFLTYGAGGSSLLLFAVFGGVGIAGYMYIKHEMETNGKYGHIHKAHGAPKSIIQNQQFFKIIKK